ncbi:M24 family metallopeptidase [Microbacteriaceae bacterium 4G12]
MLEKELKNRINVLQEKMKQDDLDAYVISSQEDIWYYTNIIYRPEERPFFIIISHHETPTLLVPKLEEMHVKKGILDTNHLTYWDYPSPKGENWYDILNEILRPFHNIGVESNISTDHFLHIQGTNVNPFNFVQVLRKVKSAYEIGKIKNSAIIADETMYDIFKHVSKETMVLEMSALAQKKQIELIQNKQLDLVNSTLLAVVWPAPESSMPHGIPDIFKTYTNGPNVAMTYYRINGYASECERTFFIGEPTEEEKEIFQHMIHARNAALGVLKAGVKVKEVDLAARNYLDTCGLKGNLLHRTGHGIGLSNHEAPFIAEGSEETLEENMVISIEPGIYIDGFGGFRHSDTVLITKDGYELLTKAPVELEELIF